MTAADETSNLDAGPKLRLPDDLVSEIEAWLQHRIGGSPSSRGVLRNQAPPLVGWAVSWHARVQGVAPNKQKVEKGALATGRVPLSAWMREYTAGRGEGRSCAEADLLAVSLQPNSTRAFLPVSKELERQGRRVAFLLDVLDGASAKLLGSQHPHVDIGNRSMGGVLWRTWQVDRGLSRLHRDEGGLRELLAAMKLPTEFAGESLLLGLSRRLRWGVWKTAVRAIMIESALSRVPAKNVVFFTERALVDELLLHTHPGAKRLFFLQGIVPDVPPLATPMTLDHAVVGSRIDVPYLRRCGLPDERISVTGYPDYDHYRSLEQPECRAELEQKLGLGPGSPVVVFGSQYVTPAFSERARVLHLDLVLRSALERPSVHFVVKLHPRQERWKPAKLPQNVSILKNYDMPRLMKAADAFVTYWSTTALEAALLGTPLIQLNATGLPDFFDLSVRLGRETARSEQDLLRQIDAVLAGPRESFVPNVDALGVIMDGRAAERAAQALLANMV